MIKQVEFDHREEWPKGPWDQEPDREEWRSHGMPCLISRNPLGAWCGYVGVPKSHPFYGKDAWDLNFELEESAHGGLTYSNHCNGHICHIPNEGESDDVWWLGFDCAHLDDYVPGLYWAMKKVGAPDPIFNNDVYRDIHYVKQEVEDLAAILAKSYQDK